MSMHRILALFALLNLLGASFVTAQPQTRKGIFRNILETFEPLNPQEERNIADALDLTGEQRQKMKEVSDRYRSDSRRLVQEYNSVYDDVVRLAASTSPDAAVVNAKLKAFHQTHQQILEREVQYWRDFTSILTPMQNKRFWNIFAMSRVRR